MSTTESGSGPGYQAMAEDLEGWQWGGRFTDGKWRWGLYAWPKGLRPPYVWVWGLGPWFAWRGMSWREVVSYCMSQGWTVRTDAHGVNRLAPPQKSPAPPT